MTNVSGKLCIIFIAICFSAISLIDASSSKVQRLNGFLGKRTIDSKRARSLNVNRPQAFFGKRESSLTAIGDQSPFNKASLTSNSPSKRGRYDIDRPQAFFGKRARPVKVQRLQGFMGKRESSEELPDEIVRANGFLGKRSPSSVNEQYDDELSGDYKKKRSDVPKQFHVVGLFGKRSEDQELSDAEHRKKRDLEEVGCIEGEGKCEPRLIGFLGKRNGAFSFFGNRPSRNSLGGNRYKVNRLEGFFGKRSEWNPDSSRPKKRFVMNPNGMSGSGAYFSDPSLDSPFLDKRSWMEDNNAGFEETAKRDAELESSLEGGNYNDNLDKRRRWDVERLESFMG